LQWTGTWNNGIRVVESAIPASPDNDVVRAYLLLQPSDFTRTLSAMINATPFNRQLSRVYTSSIGKAPLSNATSRTILSTKSNVASTFLPFRRQCQMSFS